MFAQGGKNRKKRQPQHREEISLYALEKLYSEAFEFVAANALQQSCAGPREIILEEVLGKGAHRHPRNAHMTPDLDTIPGQDGGGHELMHPATQAAQQGRGFVFASAFADDLSVQVQNLVCTEHNRIRMGARNNRGFFHRKPMRHR